MKSCPVSVIIPTYNRGEFLERSITSIFRQSMICSEIIVVDDGSEDNSLEILERLQSKSPVPLKIVCQKNAGPASARNSAIRVANCPYLAFLDSDDHWLVKKLEIQYTALRDSDGFLISHTKEKWLRRGKHLNQKKIHIPQHGEIYSHCLLLCAVGMSTVMVSQDVLTEVGFFDETLRCCEDYDMWLRVACRYPFHLVDAPLIVKEGGRDDQVSYQYRLGMDRFRIFSLQKMLDSTLLNEQMYLATFREFSRKVNVFGNGCIKHNKEKMGREYLALIPLYRQKAIRKYPELEKAINA